VKKEIQKGLIQMCRQDKEFARWLSSCPDIDKLELVMNILVEMDVNGLTMREAIEKVLRERWFGEVK